MIAREYSRSEECTTTAPVAYGGRLEEIYITLHQLMDSKDSQVIHSHQCVCVCVSVLVSVSV